MDCYNKNRKWQALKKELGIEISDFDSKRLLADDTDEDYKWFLVELHKRKEKIKKKTEVISRKDVNEYENESASKKEDKNNEEEDKIVKDPQEDKHNEEEDKIVNDPQYAMFLSLLIEDGKAYKLKTSKDGESPLFVVYEKPEESNEYDPDLPTHGYVTMGDVEDNVNSSENRRVKRRVSEEKRDSLTTEEVSRENKASEHNAIIEVHQGTPEGSCYQLLLEGNTPSEYGAFEYAGKPLKYEENVKSSSSDSEMEILDNVKDFNEVKSKAPVPAKETLKKELIRMLEKPYKNREYKGLSKYVFEEKPICRHLDLRERPREKPVSSVLKAKTKSLFEDSPVSFQVVFKKYENDKPKALNLLRMFCFWLVHVPNQDAFQPWEDSEIRKVLPRPRTR